MGCWFVGGRVFGEEIVQKSGFGGFWRFDWFGFGFARTVRARFAGSGGELQVGGDGQRKEAAERAQDLAGELWGLCDQGDHFGALDQIVELRARLADGLAGQELEQPEFAGGDFEVGAGLGGLMVRLEGVRGARFGWRSGPWQRALGDGLEAMQKAVQAGDEEGAKGEIEFLLAPDTVDGAFKQAEDAAEMVERGGVGDGD